MACVFFGGGTEVKERVKADGLFREYNTNQGRWPWPDPAGLEAVSMSNPQTWNRYVYVGNSPLNVVDALGLVRRWCKGTDCPPMLAGSMFGTHECVADGFEMPCDMVTDLLQSGAAVECPQCQIRNIPGAGWALPTVGGDNSITWSFSFPTVYGGNQLPNAGLAEALGLPTSLSGVSPSPGMIGEISLQELKNAVRARLTSSSKCGSLYRGGLGRALIVLQKTQYINVESLAGFGSHPAAVAFTYGTITWLRTGGSPTFQMQAFEMQITLLVHELRHGSGYGREIDANYVLEYQTIDSLCPGAQ